MMIRKIWTATGKGGFVDMDMIFTLQRPITDPTRLCYRVPLRAKIVSIFLQETFD